MVVAREDRTALADLQLAAYERGLEPKRLVLLDGGHFDPYEAEFENASAAAVEWFQRHLRPATRRRQRPGSYQGNTHARAIV
jgi:hypothetical protein